jgi:large subunit ribosomal protein L4
VTVVDALELGDHKTKGFVGTLAVLGHERKTLVVESAENRNLELSARNVASVTLASGAALNIYDVLSHDRLILSRAAVEALVERLAK